MSTPNAAMQTGENYVLLRSRRPGQKRVGIYMRGGCHLHSVFACVHMIRPVFEGDCCIFHEGNASRCHSDVEIQSLQPIPDEHVQPVVEKFRLGSDYFEPRLFDRTICVPTEDGPEEFPRTVVMLTVGSDSVGRRLYRHRKYGYVIDPGDTWMNGLDTILSNLASVNWFRQTFESIGSVTVDRFVDNFTRMVSTIRARAGAHVVVLNHLTIQPGDKAHCYQPMESPGPPRWREFHVVLTELSRKLDFPIVDLDRVLKLAGTGTQMDMAHYLPYQHWYVAQEAFRVMNELGVFGA
jgi:hypothetical protein